MSLKIAAVTEDGQKLSSHFGMAPSYIVYSVEEGQVVARETRAKPHNSQHGHAGGGHDHAEHAAHIPTEPLDLHPAQPMGPGQGPGHHGGHQHGRMFAPITDCQVLLCGGMGTPAYAKAQAAGLEVVLTGGSLEQAVEAYLAGTLASDMRRVHSH